METDRKIVQTVRLVLLLSIVVWVVLAWSIPPHVAPNVVLYRAITVVAIMMVIVMFMLRKLLLSRAAASLAVHPEDATTRSRWRIAHLLTYCFSEAIALYGLVLHLMGFTLNQVAPFFVAGFALVAVLGPSIPTEVSSMKAISSERIQPPE